MNKTLLKKLVRDEIKNLTEQSKDIMTDFGMLSVLDQDASKNQAIKKMAAALGVDVNINLGPGRNKIEFMEREDVNEKTFEQMITFLEKIGYNVDLGQSDRTYETEDDRRRFPRIIF
tara:strand:+ start:1531 stop:1881 length:351 start_codon:yes stop_codon:yes gene_type:complete